MAHMDSDRARSIAVQVLTAMGKRPWAVFALVGLIGALDYLSGTELSVGIFYLVPVTLVAWWHDTRRIAMVALLAGLTWLAVDHMGGHAYRHLFTPYWNALTRLGIFLSVGLVVHRARQLQVRQLDLINYVVHDLRNPLTTFVSTLELVAQAPAEDAPPAVQDCLKHCRVASKRMQTLIDSILDLARLEEGKMPVTVRALCIREVVREVISESSVFARSKNIQVREEVGPGPGLVRGDPVLLHRVLVNLLTNAIKATPEGGAIQVRAEHIHPDEIVFSVVDGGTGIPDRFVSRVFDKFVQIELQKSGASAGSGLGLAFCRLAVRAQGGRIWIQNVLDNGASVFVALPAAQTA